MKSTKLVSKTVGKASDKCEHETAFVASVTEDSARDSVYLHLDCPDCGAALILVGSFVTHPE